MRIGIQFSNDLIGNMYSGHLVYIVALGTFSWVLKKIKIAGMRPTFQLLQMHIRESFSLLLFGTCGMKYIFPMQYWHWKRNVIASCRTTACPGFPRREKSYVKQNILSPWWLKYYKNDFKNKCTLCGLANYHTLHIFSGNYKPCLSIEYLNPIKENDTFLDILL